MFRREILFFLCALVITGLASCGNDDNDDEASDCELMVEAVCEKACECGDAECVYFNDTVSAVPDTLEDCISADTFNHCGDEPIDMDFEACIEAINAQECGENSGGDPGVELPQECAELL